MWNRFFSRDAQAVARTLAGDREAFGAIVERHFDAVKAFALSRVSDAHDAEDVAQETFLKAFRSLGTLREPAKVGAWLLSIARNVSNTLLEARRRRREELPELEPCVERDPAREELHALLRAQVGALDEPYRDVLMLHYFAGKTTREIAALLDISRDAAQKRLQRGRQALGERLVLELGDAFEPNRREDGGRRKVMGAILALPAAPVTREAAAGVGSGLPVGVYLALGVVGAAVVGGVTWFNQSQYRDVQDAYRMAEGLPGDHETRLDPANGATFAAEDVLTGATLVDAATSIVGKVFDTEGAAISGAMVRGYAIGAAVPESRTNEEGGFALAELPPQSYRVRVTHEDYVGTWVPNVARGTPDLRIVLEPYPSCVLRVTDASDASPISDFYFVDPVNGAEINVTKPDGTVAIGRISPGKPTRVAVRAPRYRDGVAMIQTAKDLANGVDVALERATVVNGVVRSKHGGLISGARIFADASTGGWGDSMLTTNERGEFRIATPVSTPTRVYALHATEGAGYADLRPEAGAWDSYVEISLQESGALDIAFDGSPMTEAYLFSQLEYVDAGLEDYPDLFVSDPRYRHHSEYVPDKGIERIKNHFFEVLLPGTVDVVTRVSLVSVGFNPAMGGYELRDRVTIVPGEVARTRFRIPDLSGKLTIELPDAVLSDTARAAVDVWQDDGRLRTGYHNFRVRNGSIAMGTVPIGPCRLSITTYAGKTKFCSTVLADVEAGDEMVISPSFDLSTGMRWGQSSIRFPEHRWIVIVDGPPATHHWTPGEYGRDGFEEGIFGIAPGDYRLGHYWSEKDPGYTKEREYIEWSVRVSEGEILEVVPPF